jgi:hypothetical protein
MPSYGFLAVDRPGTRCCGRGQASSARFDVHADRTNRCGDFWLGGCTRRSHRVARLVVRRRFTACWPR